MVSLGGYVKIMLTYDIIPQMAEDYYEFMLGELVPAVESMGFKKVASLGGRIRDYNGSYRDLVVLEIPLSDKSTWWKE